MYTGSKRANKTAEDYTLPSLETPADKTATSVRGKSSRKLKFLGTKLQIVLSNAVTSAPCSETVRNILLTGQNCDVIVQ